MNQLRHRKIEHDKGVSELPHDKDFHFFVCYASEDVDRVRVIIEQLEENGFKCFYSDRDFTAGESLMGNMKQGISKSLGMLIILTEQFSESKFCDFEMNEALHVKITNDYIMIPVKLEPCVTPTSIKHINYIDAEDDQLNRVYLKVMKAFQTKELEKERVNRNGETLSYSLKPFKHGRLSLQRYRLELDENTRQQMQDHGFEISDKLFDEIKVIVQNAEIVKYKHIRRDCCMISSLILCLLLQIMMVVFLSVMMLTSDKKLQDSVPQAGYILIVCTPLLITGWCICGYCGRCKRQSLTTDTETSGGFIFKSSTQEKFRLNSQLWDKVTGNIENKPTLIAVFHHGCLRFMKYNMRPCKDFFMRKLTKNKDLLKFLKPNETYEEYTKRVFETFLRKNAYMLHDIVSESNRRHKIATGAKCTCLLVENWLLH